MPDSSSNANQDAGGKNTLEAGHVAQPLCGTADQGPSDFPLLEAMLQPDVSDTATGRLSISESRLCAEHLTADDHDLDTSADAGKADRGASGSGQPQEAHVSDAPPSAEPDVPPSRPAVKGSLRDRVKAFAALRK